MWLTIECGLPNRSPRLHAGTNELRPFEFPWLGHLFIQGITSHQVNLINDRYVIGSASPLIGLTPYDVKVILGLYDSCAPSVTSTMYSVTDIRIHPEYFGLAKKYNVAVLKLSAIVPFSRYVAPICMPLPGAIYDGQVATIATWMSSENVSLADCRPRKIGLPILEAKTCVISGPISDEQGCVGVVGSQSALCMSDTGAGLLYRDYFGHYELVGVLSDYQSCEKHSDKLLFELNNNYRLPLYTKLDSIFNWLLEATLEGCFCDKT